MFESSVNIDFSMFQSGQNFYFFMACYFLDFFFFFFFLDVAMHWTK